LPVILSIMLMSYFSSVGVSHGVPGGERS
jgi:hypothetical protein